MEAPREIPNESNERKLVAIGNVQDSLPAEAVRCRDRGNSTRTQFAFLSFAALLLATSTRAQLGWSQPLGLANPFSSLVRFKDQYVVYSKDGIFLSRDGGIWTSAAWQPENTVRNLAAFDTLVLAVGSPLQCTNNNNIFGSIAFSNDGADWTTPLTKDPFEEPKVNATATDSGYMATGFDGGVFSSYTGKVSWGRAFDNGTNGLFGLAAGNGTYVMTQLNGEVLTTNAAFAGTIHPSSLSTLRCHGVAYGKGLFAVATLSGQILTSPDGSEWTSRASRSKALQNLRFQDGTFYAWGDSGCVMRSDDGLAWESIDLPGLGSVSGVAQGAELLATTLDKEVWVRREGTWAALSTPRPKENLIKVAAGENGFMAVGDSGLVLTSPDGLVWQERAKLTGRAISALIWWKQRWYALPIWGQVYSSENGDSWTQTQIEIGGFQSMAASNGQLLVGGSENGVYSSTDGESWRKVSNKGGLVRMKFGSGQFYATDENRIYRSPDGATWTSLLQTDHISTFAIHDSTITAPVLTTQTAVTSLDGGKNWMEYKAPPFLRGIAWTDSGFMAVGMWGMITTSKDGQTWTQLKAGTTSHMNDIAVGADALVAVGDSGTILTHSLKPNSSAGTAPNPKRTPGNPIQIRRSGNRWSLELTFSGSKGLRIWNAKGREIPVTQTDNPIQSWIIEHPSPGLHLATFEAAGIPQSGAFCIP